MNRYANIYTARNAFFATLFFAAVVLAFLAPRAAVNVDEQLHYPHAKKVVNWYFTGGEDSSCLETPKTNLKYYGQSVDNITALVNRIFHVNNEFLTRHITGAFFFWLLLFFAGMIGYQLTGSFWVSALTVISVMLIPRLFGQAFGNLKDIPFAVGYVAGIFMIIQFVKELPKPRWSTTIWLGLAIAFTCSVRIGGLILFAYLGLAIIAYIISKPFLLKHIVSTKLCLVRLLGQVLVIVIIGYFAGLLFWPFALQDIFKNPLESLSVMEHYSVSIRQVFEGKVMWSTQLPWYYLLKWLMISIPEFVILGLICFFCFFNLNKIKQNMEQLILELFVIFTFLFPIVYVIVIDSNLYSGIRQMLFVLPLIAILSSIGIFKILNTDFRRVIKIPVIVFFFLLMMLPLKHQAATFPSDYIYFNSISGGNKKAWANYEYDYYFHGIKKSSEYLINLIDGENVTVATNCNLSNYFEDIPNIKYNYARYLERSSVDWDYGLFGVNYIHPFLLKSGKWQSTDIVKTFYHLGNPLVVLLKRRGKSDLKGIGEMQNGEFESAKISIERAINANENNIWLLVQMAKISLNLKDFESFNTYLQKGRELYPTYEPFFLLEAQYLFDNEDYSGSKEVLDRLIEVNPRYNSAAPLLNAVNNKLNI